MGSVFLLWHMRPTADRLDDDCADNKLIGVYSSAAEADAARKRKIQFEGFRDYPNYFHVDEYELDKDARSEGFIVTTAR
ncbi:MULTISPECIES: hypothetical protein [unclassified Bradyrhizobium]|uniref:DUF7336 domain-containing protein n=1 Tax=unclassified Bradyrhizobium TaxID=2631580 RepID=UPI0028EDB5F6|nr:MULTISPECIES: hypothetical protein [unclassified Bradyrhizobium]